MQHFDLTIIGTGSGNSIIDERYDGKKVAICEQGTFGGTCLNVGCIPTKMFVYAAEVATTIEDAARFGVDAHIDGVRWRDIVSRVFGRIDPIALGGEKYRKSAANVTVFDSHTRFGPTQPDGRYVLRTEDGQEFTSERVVIAAGARAVVPPAITDSGVAFHTSDTVMRIPELPKRLVIIGGGYVAVEFAHVFSSLGSEVTLIVRGSRLLSSFDDDIAERYTAVAASKWDVRCGRNVVGGHTDDAGTTLELDDGSSVSADVVLVATGRHPNGDLLDATLAGVEVNDNGQVVVDEFQRTTARGIFALGDVSSDYLLKHVANHEARVVQHNLLVDWDDVDALQASDHRHVPAAVFTDPQVATIGLTEKDARATGLKIRVKIQDFGAVAYGWAMEDTTGICKLIVDADTDLILGAHLMGHQASTLIQPLIQAITFGLPAAEMARGQYWIHPALPEVIENALLGLGDDG